MENYYDTLGLKPSANIEDINAAFDKLSLKFDPEKNNGETLFENTFKQVKDAYLVLSKEDSRKEYDKSINVNQTKPARILQFKTTKDYYEEGDLVEISWETENSKKVIVDIFGEVEPTGSKVFRPKNLGNKSLSLKISVYPEAGEEPITQSLKVPIVQEIDFGSEKKNEVTNEGNSTTAKENAFKEDELNLEQGDNSFDNSKEKKENFFSFSGRLRRRAYFLRVVLLAIPTAFSYALFEETTSYYKIYDEGLLALSLIALIISSFLNLMQFVKRLHDINHSGWLVLITLIPYLGALFGLFVMFIDGTEGPNAFGPDPKGRLRKEVLGVKLE